MDWARNIRDASDDFWRGMVSHKSKKSETRVVTSEAAWCPVIDKNKLKNWMLEEPVKCNGCSNIQFFLREIY